MYSDKISDIALFYIHMVFGTNETCSNASFTFLEISKIICFFYKQAESTNL